MLLLGLDVEESDKKIVPCIREAGGVINNSIVIGILSRILRDTDSNLLAENWSHTNGQLSCLMPTDEDAVKKREERLKSCHLTFSCCRLSY